MAKTKSSLDKRPVRFTFTTVLLLYVFSQSLAQDSPALQYRGMHLDVSRHFFPVETICRYVDTISAAGLNFFHWHLTDDQGWRIEIKSYPELTSVGSHRSGLDGKSYSGFYTQEDIKAVVAYASSKNITVVPEIDLPGHSSAAIAAYPWLSCHDKPIAVPNKWGIFENILCTNDSSMNFVFNVLNEVCALFPGPYIHIGGDEVPKKQWQQCHHCRTLKKKLSLGNYHKLQGHFTHLVAQYLLSRGKRSIVWGEAIKGGLQDSTIVMSWRGKLAGIRAARKGHQVIMAPRFSCYFDYPQSIRDRKGAWYMTYLPPSKVARFSPYLKHRKKINKYIIGAEATLWTEHVTNEPQLWHQLIPRVYELGKKLNSFKTEEWK